VESADLFPRTVRSGSVKEASFLRALRLVILGGGGIVRSTGSTNENKNFLLNPSLACVDMPWTMARYKLASIAVSLCSGKSPSLMPRSIRSLRRPSTACRNLIAAVFTAVADDECVVALISKHPWGLGAHLTNCPRKRILRTYNNLRDPEMDRAGCARRFDNSLRR
jgi:hypothetical protein